jgi:prepilin-type N-terminal cleavage/methylation domain-containing protein
MPAKILKGRLFARSTSNKLVLPHPFSGGKKGFTLIELLVVLAIIGILATIILANYTDFGARQEVRNAAAELKTNLRKYQTFGFSSHKNPTNLPDGVGCNYDGRQLDHYEITVSSPATYDVNIVCHELAPPNAATTVAVTNEIPWGPDVPIESVGRDGGIPCGVITIRFLPINEGVELWCGPVPVMGSVFINVGQPAGHISTVTVTRAGEIRDD